MKYYIFSLLFNIAGIFGVFVSVICAMERQYLIALGCATITFYLFIKAAQCFDAGVKKEKQKDAKMKVEDKFYL